MALKYCGLDLIKGKVSLSPSSRVVRLLGVGEWRVMHKQSFALILFYTPEQSCVDNLLRC